MMKSLRSGGGGTVRMSRTGVQNYNMNAGRATLYGNTTLPYSQSGKGRSILYRKHLIGVIIEALLMGTFTK